VQSAAYVARERYYDDRLGETFNYRFGSEDRNPLTESSQIAEASDHILREGRHAELGSRQQVLFSALYAPEGAPDWCRGAANIERFWNAAETTERRSDAQIAERIIIALPKEFEPRAERLGTTGSHPRVHPAGPGGAGCDPFARA
jgi:MobA/MobL family